MSSTPLVSIVLATYNRCGVLFHAIESVRRSTLHDWELIVVGDCCTDDSAAVVAAFADPRITFVNLERNVGEQSGPNNDGVRRARGKYLAFLNHDDLYFPDHLEAAVAHLERTAADFVWAPTITAFPMSHEDLVGGRWSVRLHAVTTDERYHPRVFVFASAWVMTRELSDRIGTWHHAHDTFVTPSQDWLFRAWRAGASMRQLPHPTVMAIPAQPRKSSYAVSGSPEHNFFAARMHDDPMFRERVLAHAATQAELDAREYRLGRAVRSVFVRPIVTAAMALGFHPNAPIFALRYGRRGNLVNTIRRRTGLSNMSRRGQ